MAGKDESLIVQTIEAEILQLVANMRRYKHINQDTSMSIIKSTRVYPEALLETIEEYQRTMTDTKSQAILKNLTTQVKYMAADGKTRVLNYASTEEHNISCFGYFCAAVRKYRYKEEIVLDFCVSTCSYSGLVREKGSAFLCGAAIVGGVALGALSLATGGLAAIAIGASAGILTNAGIAMRPETLIQTASGSGKMPKDLKSVLLACFIYELITRGYAVLTEENVLRFTEN